MATWRCSSNACRLHHACPCWKLQRHEADLKLTKGFRKIAHILLSGTAQSEGRSTTGELYSAATTSDLWAQNPHGNNVSSRHLPNLTLFGLFGLESTLSSSKHTHTHTHTHTPSKKEPTLRLHTWVFCLSYFFFCIPTNLQVQKCWDEHSKAVSLWFLFLRKSSFKIDKILSIIKCGVWMRPPHQKVSEVHLSTIMTSLLWCNAIQPWGKIQ